MDSSMLVFAWDFIFFLVFIKPLISVQIQAYVWNLFFKANFLRESQYSIVIDLPTSIAPELQGGWELNALNSDTCKHFKAHRPEKIKLK